MAITTLLFFDLDATLVENRFSRKAVAPLIEEFAQKTGQSVDEAFRAFSAENMRRQRDNPDHVLTMDWDDILHSLAQQHAVTLSERIDPRWQRFAHVDDIEILDHSLQVLRQLQAPHRQLILATKGLSKYQDPVLRLTGLDALLDDILTPDITGYLKTSDGYFDKYRSHTAVKIQIGDHYYDDVICPKRRGYYSVMRVPLEAVCDSSPFERPRHLAELRDHISTYPEDGSDVVPDAVVVSLEELPALIPQIEAYHAKLG